MTARGIVRKVGRVVVVTTGSLVGTVLGLVVLAFVALMIEPVRAFAVKKGVAYTNESVLDGMRLEVKAVDRIDPWGLQARGIQLFDDQGRLFVKVPWVLVRLRPWQLVNDTLRLTRVEVDGAAYHLYPPDPDAPEEPEEPPSEPSTFVIRAENVRVRGFDFYTTLGEREVHANVSVLRAAGQYGPKIGAAIQQLALSAKSDGEELLKLHTTRGDWQSDDGGEIGIEGTVAGAPLTLQASVPGIDDMEPWPIRSASLRLSGLTRRALTLAGVQDGMELKVPLSLSLDAKVTDGELLRAQAKLTAGKLGHVSIDAQSDHDSYGVDVSVTPMQLASVAGTLPPLHVRGSLMLRATHGPDMLPRKIELRWRGIEVDDGAFPPGVLHASMALPMVRLHDIQISGLEQNFGVHAEYDLDSGRGNGAIEFNQLKLAAIEVLRTHGIAGHVDGTIQASYTPPKLAAEGTLEVRGFSHPNAKLGALDLALAIGGTATTPQGHFKLGVEQLAAGGTKLDRLSVDAQANLRDLTAKVELAGPDVELRAELGGQRTRSGHLRVQGIGRGHYKKRDVHFDLRELAYDEGELTLQELKLYSGQQAVFAQGKLDQESRVLARLALREIDLKTWSELADVQGLTGFVGGNVEIAGTTSEPRVDAKLKIRQVAYKAELPIDGWLDLQGDLGERKLDLKTELWSTEELGARIALAVSMPKKPALDKAFMLARVDSDMSIYMPIEQISALADDQLAGLEGMLEAKLHAQGTLEDPDVVADVTATMRLPEADEALTDAMHLSAKIDKQQATLNLWGRDEQGPLLTLDGKVTWPGGSPRAALEHPAEWRSADFYTQAELSQRRLDTMQGVFAYFSKLYAMDLPLRVGGKVVLRGEQGVLDGDVDMRAVVFGDKLDGRCRIGAQSSIDIGAKLKQDEVQVDLGVKTDGGGNVKGTLRSRLALNALEGSGAVFGPAKLDIQGDEVAIYRMPGLCNLAGGAASFQLEASGLGDQKPALSLNAKVADLRARDTKPVNVTLSAVAGGKSNQALLKTSIKSEQKDVGYIEAQVPLSYPEDSTTPTVRPDAPLQAKLQLDKLQLANFFAFAEALGRVSGTASANISVAGKLNDPVPNGYIALDGVNLSIASLAQPFRGVKGRIEVKGRSVNIQNLTARDRDGKLVVDGYATLHDDMTGEGGLYVEADKFPLRQQGTVVGELTTRMRFDAKIPKDLQMQAKLNILDGRFWLTGERGKDVQSLDAHPDVHFADEREDEIAELAQDQQAPGADGSITLGSFVIKTENPLWLLHQDFSLQVGVDLALKHGGELGPKLEGEATLVRGELNLLGKKFKLEKGSIRFAGPLPPDPELDIKATYNPPSGTPLVVQVSGHGSQPILQFSGAASTAAEAMAVLTGVGNAQGSPAGNRGSAESDASAQMASLAANMTAGLLVMSARREFGDWVPMLSVETSDTGAPSATAGFDASNLIPPWLKGFARGAYVEGVVGAQSERGGKTGVGVRLDVALPRDFISSLGYSQTGWSADVAWSP